MKPRLSLGTTRLARDERGTSLVELALFMPIIGTLLLGMVDLGEGLSARHDLQQAANRTMELVMARTVTAAPGATDVSYEFLRQEAATAAGVPLANVVLTRWRECNGTVQATYNAVCPPDSSGVAQEVARYLRIQITSGYRPRFELGPFAMNASRLPDGRIRMVAQAAIRIQ